MRSIIAFFIRNEVLVNLLILLIAIFGIISALQLTSSFFPERSTQFINIEATYPGASPREIEEGITLKIEDNLQGISGIDRVTSTSTENSAKITIELLPRVDANEILQEVKNAVDRISSFPEGLEQVITFKQEVVNFTAKVALSGNVPIQALKQEAEEVEDDFLDYESISKVQLSGFTEEEIEIQVKENLLRGYELTFEEVANAVSRENINVTGGVIRGKDKEYIIRGNNKQYYARNLEDIIIKAEAEGNVVRLKDVATINDTWSENTDRIFYNDDRTVTITVNTTNEEDILEAAEYIRNYVEEYNQENKAITATLIDDATDTLRERISLLEENGLLGAGLVLIILGFFLRLRMSFWVAVGIPISFLGMFILASFYGLTINVLSLFGMILVVGILVDDGVVVGENIYQKYEKGLSPFQAAIQGTLEVLPSIIAAILTTSIAFAFFFFIEGQLGEFFSDVSFVVIASLSISLVEVLFFLPAHMAHSKDLQKDYEPPRWKEKLSYLMFKFRDGFYAPILRFVLKYKIFYVLLIISAIIFTFFAVGQGIIRSAFFPNIEQNSIMVSLEMPAGTPDSITEKNIRKVQQAARQLNQKYKEDNQEDEDQPDNVIKNVELILGPGSNEATANIYLAAAEKREIRSFAIATDLREATGPIPRATKLSFETQTPFGKPVVVSLSSPDFEELRAAKSALRNELQRLETLKDVVDSDKENQPEVEISLNEKGRLLGLNLSQVIGQVRSGFFGYEIQRLQRGTNEVKVWVRYNKDNRNSIEDLKQMRIRTPQGDEFPLGNIANVGLRKGLIAINHLNGDREIKVEADLASLEVSAPEQINRIDQEIMPEITGKFPGVEYTFEGQFRQTRKLQESIGSAGPIILILIIAMLVFTFRSFSQAFALLLLIPFGLIGAIWGHLIHDLPLSVLSIMGFIALIGILFNDGLVFINTFNQELKQGKKYNDALVDTAFSRFRPLVLTTITTAAGLAPLIFETSFQAQFLIPMAVTIAYGLIVGSFLISTLLPILMITFNRGKVYLRWLWTGHKPEPEIVERAVKEERNKEKYG
jgi:multidrug efflux pump subunit AcrB